MHACVALYACKCVCVRASVYVSVCVSKCASVCLLYSVCGMKIKVPVSVVDGATVVKLNACEIMQCQHKVCVWVCMCVCMCV